LFGLKKLTDEPRINSAGCPDISKLSCDNSNSCTGTIDMLETSYECTESMYSTSKSKTLPVPPRSILQHQKVGFALSGTDISVAPSYDVKNQNGLKNIIESLQGVDKIRISKFTQRSDVYVDVALGQNGKSSFTSLEDASSSLRGPVEDVPKRINPFIASALKSGWWSVNLLRKPYSPQFSDYIVHLVVNRTEEQAQSLSVMMTTNFVPKSNVTTLSSKSYLYTCNFDVDGTCFELRNRAKLWSNSPFSPRSIVPQGNDSWFGKKHQAP
jgi:hypothetical protein